jgi:hypothetical protein
MTLIVPLKPALLRSPTRQQEYRVLHHDGNLCKYSPEFIVLLIHLTILQSTCRFASPKTPCNQVLFTILSASPPSSSGSPSLHSISSPTAKIVSPSRLSLGGLVCAALCEAAAAGLRPRSGAPTLPMPASPDPAPSPKAPRSRSRADSSSFLFCGLVVGESRSSRLSRECMLRRSKPSSSCASYRFRVSNE